MELGLGLGLGLELGLGLRCEPGLGLTLAHTSLSLHPSETKKKTQVHLDQQIQTHFNNVFGKCSWQK